MKFILGFPQAVAAVIVAVGIAYFLSAWAPLWWPGLAAYRSRPIPKPWLFVAVVACLSYGIFAFIFLAITFPAQLWSVFIAPQLDYSGYPHGRFLVVIADFVSSYWWMILPPALLVTTVVVTRMLLRNWRGFCAAVDG